MRLFFLIQCFKKNYSWKGLHYGTENVEFVNLCKGFQVLRDQKNCDYMYASNTLKYCTTQTRGGSIISRDERLNLNPSFNFFFFFM